MWKQPQILIGLWVTGVIFTTQPAWGDETSGVISNLKQLEPPTTSINGRLAQNPNKRSPIVIIAVKINPTKQGVELILQTDKGAELQIQNRSVGNSFIAEIPNAQLRLASGDTFTFTSQKPTAGITGITVINKDSSTIQITVTGETALPTAELFDSDEGLILGFTPVVANNQTIEPDKPQSETPPKNPSAQTDEPIELVVVHFGEFSAEFSTFLLVFPP